MRLIPIIVAVVALSACSEPTPPPADAPAAETGPPGRQAIYAAQSEGPEAFVRALYAPYVAGGPKDVAPAPGQDPIYSRMMNATIGADFRIAKGEVPSLNYDLICGCQDQGAFTLDSVVVTQVGANAADAAVAFTNAGETTRQTLKLQREGGAWKVDDIIGADGKSVQDETIKLIEAAGG